MVTVAMVTVDSYRV